MTSEPAVHHWFAPPPPEVRRVELRLPVAPLLTGWNRALDRLPGIEVSRIAISVSPPRVVSIPIHRLALGVQSFRFPEPSADEPSSPSYPSAAS